MSVAAHCANHSELVLYHSDILQPSALPSNTTDQAGNRQWHKQRVPSEVLHQAQGINWQSLCGDSLAVIVTASANAIRKCSHCRISFSNVFCMSEIWWEDYCKRSNGYVGSEEAVDRNGDTGHNTWVFFEVKQAFENQAYEWNKINVFTRWIPTSKQIVIILFNSKPPLARRTLESLKNSILLHDPFWVYTSICDEVVRLQNKSVWAIRDKIRNVEKEQQPGGKPAPDYRRLHNIARHATHVTETLEVASLSMDRIISLHQSIQQAVAVSNTNQWHAVHDRLNFYHSLTTSLYFRSISNEKRLANEIQLAFNTVAQYQSSIAVQIGKASQVDGAAMKTLASLTLVFLPPTFISAIFSMSFFHYDSGVDWGVSDKFWIYWVVAIPLTLLTPICCYFWHRQLPR